MIKKKKKNAYYYFILRISNNIYFHIVSEILYRKYLQHNEINIKVWKYKINPSLYKYFDQSKKKLIWLILTARKIIICISSRLRKSVILFAEIHSRPFLHPRWIPSTTLIRILSRDSFLLVRPRFFPPPPLDVHGRCLEKRGTFPRLKSTLLVKSPNSSHLRPFSIATSAATPQTHRLEQRSFRLSTFIDSYVDRCANDSSLFYSSRHILLSPVLQATIYHTWYARERGYLMINIFYYYTLIYSYIFIDIFYYKKEEIVYTNRTNSLILFIRISYLYLYTLEKDTICFSLLYL